MKIEKKIVKLLKKSNKIAIFGHRNPDRDAVGSMFGLASLLKNMGKEVKTFAYGNFPHSYENLKGDFEIISEIDKGIFDYFDLFIFVDFSEYKMLGKFYEDYGEDFMNIANKTIVFDHHLNNPDDKNRIVYQKIWNSNCENLAEFSLKYFKNFFTADTAKFFYTGIATDTGGFLFGNNKLAKHSFQVVVKLLDYNFDKLYIIQNLFFENDIRKIKFTNNIISRAKLDGNIYWTWYDEDEKKDYGLEDENIEVIGNFRKISGAEIYIMFKILKKEEKIGVSMRTKLTSNINLAEIAHNFGGGGHAAAAGFSVKLEKNSPIEEQFKKILKEIKKHLKPRT